MQCNECFCLLLTLEINIDNNVVLVVAEAQMSVLTEIKLTPTSLQRESQMSKCVITVVCSNAHIHSVILGGINDCDIVFLISSVLILNKHQVTGR